MIKKIIVIVLLVLYSTAFSQTTSDSLHLKIFVLDRDYFLKLQETVSSKNQYIGLQWCIDLLNKYIEMEEKKLKDQSK